MKNEPLVDFGVKYSSQRKPMLGGRETQQVQWHGGELGGEDAVIRARSGKAWSIMWGVWTLSLRQWGLEMSDVYTLGCGTVTVSGRSLW